MTNDTDRARDALFHIDAGCARDEWVRAGMSARSAGLSFDDFHGWSASAGNYAGEKDCRATWKSFDASGAVTAGTLFGMAFAQGWQDPSKRTSKARPTPLQAKPKQTPPKPAKEAANSNAADVWDRCITATDCEPYLYRKGGKPDGLRVYPASAPLLIILGQNVTGWLVVPCWSGDKLMTLQFIPKEKGKKLNLSGASFGDGFFPVGDIATAKKVYIVEGLSKGWATDKADPASAAACCFGAGRMATVAKTIHAQHPAAALVIVSDKGKEKEAAKIAADVVGQWVAMPDGKPDNYDANDYLQEYGVSALADLLARPQDPPKPEPLLKLVSVFDVLSNPSHPPAFIWDGYLPRGVVALLGAHGGTGKSTIALMLAVCAALGRALFGVATARCNVVFASFEDSTGIVRHRLAAICRACGINPADIEGRLHIVDGTANPELFTADNRGAGDTTTTYVELCKLVQSTNAGLVVIDNSSDSYGGDEINRRQVRAFMRSLTQVARLTDCAVLLLAHVDKATSRAGKAEGGEAYSGSTAWHNSARSRLFMSRGNDGLLTLAHQKSNFGRMREPLNLWWPDNGMPMLADDAPDAMGLTRQGRADDVAAAVLLRIVAEYEDRGQYCSPAITSRNNVFAVLKTDTEFKALKLRVDDTKRIVTQCQRAKWIEPMEYRSIDRKPHQRWTLTADGRRFAGLPAAPTAPTTGDGASINMAQGGAPTAPTSIGGVGEERAHKDGATLVQEAAHA